MFAFSPRARRGAFTLVELLVATTILLVIMAVLLQMIGSISQIWKTSSGKVSAFQNARSAFSTITGTLSRATLNTYNDYVDKNNLFRTTATTASFAPVGFARASELHFLSGSAAGPAPQGLLPGADPLRNPGDVIFFQAPLGDTLNDAFANLNRTVNSVSFYVQYGVVDDPKVIPPWLLPLASGARRFRLMQVVEPTENLLVYQDTAKPAYTIDWLKAFTTPVDLTKQPRTRVLAEDVTLLLFRPRLSPKDEEGAATYLGTAYSSTTQGSILCPSYNFDSRAWQTGYPAAGRVMADSAPAKRVLLMRNQTPPIVDVAMVCVDPQTVARFDRSTDVPPPELQIPAGLFADSSKMDQDLATYGAKLAAAKIRYRLFRTSVEIRGSKWSNN